MLSLRFVAVKDIPCPLNNPPVEKEGGNSLAAGNATINPTPLWCVAVAHGSQRQRTRSVSLCRGHSHDKNGAKDPSGGALWDEEIDIEDAEGQDTVEISLLLDLAPTEKSRKKLRHSITTIEMQEFRDKREESVSVWMPLRSAKSGIDSDFGAIQVSAIYSEDYVAQGYMFGLFCGLAPMSLTCSWLADTLSFPGRAADTYSAGCIPSSDNSHAKDAGDYSSPLNVQAAGKKSLAITKSAVAEQSPTVQAPLATKTPSDACKSGGIEAPYPAGAVLGC